MYLIVYFGLFHFFNQHFLVNGEIYNHTQIDLSKCKVHYSRSGRLYKDFYSIVDIPIHNDTLLLDFHFSVLAPSDAHILLAPSQNVQENDPVYEIVIGAGGNTFCDIRRRQKSDVKASVRVKGLLNALDPQSFWLHITKDGDIEVGRESEELPFISWVDPDPLPLKVISFSTWSGVEAKWYFDCKFDDIKKIDKPLTDLEKLRRDLLYHYNPYVRPVINASTFTNISMALNIHYISLDEHRALMDLLGVTKMTWQDEKLIWDPSDYGDIKVMHIFRREIWQPDLVLYNALGDPRDLLEDALMVVHNTGEIQWSPKITLKVFCDSNDLGTWPKDNHKCNVILGFMKEFNSLKLSFKKNESALILHDFLEWTVLEADVISGLIFNEKNETSDPAIFEIIFTLKRNSKAYDWLFFSPFIAISMCLLSTFWLDPFGKMKLSLGCLQMVISTLMLLILAIIVPKHVVKVPFLVTLYNYCLIASLVAVILAIFVINLARNNHKKPLPILLRKILTNTFVKTILFLPNIKMPDKYGNLDDDPEKLQSMWHLLGISLDRIAFSVYLALTVYVIILNQN